jgi:hypothetical protein
LRTSQARVLKPLGLRYYVKDGLLTVTSALEADAIPKRSGAGDAARPK